MSDEDKSMEEIVAELERFEAKRCEEKDSAAENDPVTEETIESEEAAAPEYPQDGLILERPFEEQSPEDSSPEEGGPEAETLNEDVPEEAGHPEEGLDIAGPPPEKGRNEPLDEQPEKIARPHSSRMTIVLAVVLALLIAAAYFVWPTIYEHGTATIQGTTYALRTHRLTGDQEYRVGEKWLNAPPADTSTYRGRISVPVKAAPAPKEAESEEGRGSITKELQTQAVAPSIPPPETEPKEEVSSSEGTSPPVPVEEPAAHEDKMVAAGEKQSEASEAERDREAQAEDAAETVQVKSEENTVKETVTAAASATKDIAAPAGESDTPVSHGATRAGETRTDTPAEKIVPKPEAKGGYVVQIGAMRVKEFAYEMLERAEDRGFDAQMRTVRSKAGILWHLVLLGSFTDADEALVFIKEKKLAEIYPGCFAKKLRNP